MAKQPKGSGSTKKGDAASSGAEPPISAVAPSATPPAGGSATSTYQVLARRYRSRDFAELIGQESIARTLQNAMRSGRTAHAYLFCGTRGVGKTSMARIFARALNAGDELSERDAVAGAILRGEDIDVIEIDAASNRGIDNARDLIAGAGLLPARGRYKIYIIDEVHMLTTPAFNALLKTMEEPPAHVKFILCTTEPQSVPATIQSRCQRFDFRSIPVPKIAEHLRGVLAAERASADERVVMQIARLANGSMRDALSLLERLLAAAEPDAGGALELSWVLLEDIFGLPDETLFERLIEAIGRSDAAAALAAGGELLERGLSIERSLDLLAERFRWMMLAAVCGVDTPLLEIASESRATIAALAEPFDAASLVHLIALCDAVAAKARDASSPRALFDAALVRMCLTEQFASAAALLSGAGGATRGELPRPKKASERAADLGTRPADSSPPRPPVAAERTPRPIAPVSVPPPVPAAAVAEPKPAAGSAVGSAAVETLTWEMVVDRAQASPRDAALLSGLTCRSFDGRTLHLSAAGGAAGTGFLAANPDLLKSAIRRIAGRPLEVRLEVEAASPRTAGGSVRGAIPAAVREHPLIKLAEDLFGAAIVGVTARPAAVLAELEAGPAAIDGDSGAVPLRVDRSGDGVPPIDEAGSLQDSTRELTQEQGDV